MCHTFLLQPPCLRMMDNIYARADISGFLARRTNTQHASVCRAFLSDGSFDKPLTIADIARNTFGACSFNSLSTVCQLKLKRLCLSVFLNTDFVAGLHTCLASFASTRAKALGKMSPCPVPAEIVAMLLLTSFPLKTVLQIRLSSSSVTFFVLVPLGYCIES